MTENKILNKIRGLIAKADSVAGTPEADTLRAKAFELLAKYGIDEAMATRTGTVEEEAGDSLKKVTFNLPEPFAEERMLLVWGIARSLHCAGVRKSDTRMEIWGVGRHISRVRFLYNLLLPQMMQGASATRSENPFAIGVDTHTGVSSVNGHRAAWMLGFGDAVSIRIKESEDNAAGLYDKNTGGNAAALMMLSDCERAEAAMRKAYPNMGAGKARSRGGDGYNAGSDAGQRADVGNTRVAAGRVSIG
ncbi:DUF2786 domain-containing protein [Rhodococcus erythropolis]|uniref:DUF2786 domain-containing protein n=1 Tax=Rhodococcus erythropolis TaxID=1833 RepID=UPI0024BB007A|nr:DUF2786 domain-containing protein [Rhodococcus erythropolis]MDJ0404011.1 DUF2786 domain-containing protein [Rhodococcus erythropolis]